MPRLFHKKDPFVVVLTIHPDLTASICVYWTHVLNLESKIIINYDVAKRKIFS